MSSPVPNPPVAAPEGPSLTVRIAAVAVIFALAALAAYTMFSGPTRVTIGGPQTTAPSMTAPPVSQQKPEGEGGRGD
jgi:hypothetical protein